MYNIETFIERRQLHIYNRQFSFGNRMKQIRNAINVGLQKNCWNISFSDDSKIIKLSAAQNNINKDKDYSFIEKLNQDDSSIFLRISNIIKIIPEFDPEQNDQKVVNNIIEEYVKCMFNFNYNFNTVDIERLGLKSSDYLCVHIRSGDIFDTSPLGQVHSSYVQPPYDFYRLIIDLPKYKDVPVVLIAEDTANPVINKLLRNYPNIIFKKRSLLQDQEIILNAKRLVYGVGTFIPELIKLSKKSKKMIEWSFTDGRTEKNTILLKTLTTEKKIFVKDYLEEGWKCTAKQCDTMLNFKLKNHCTFSKLEELLKDF